MALVSKRSDFAQLLDIDEEIAFENEFAFLVFLGCFVGLVLEQRKNKVQQKRCHTRRDNTNIFPSQSGIALDTIDIAAHELLG